MEDELPKEIEEQKNQRAEFRLGLRKKKLQEMIREKKKFELLQPSSVTLEAWEWQTPTKPVQKVPLSQKERQEMLEV